MQQEKIKLKNTALNISYKINNKLNENKDMAYSFFSGELYKTYIETIDAAKDSVKSIRRKIDEI